jgi:hypothetical protein
MAQLKYLGMTTASQNVIQEGIKRRLSSGNACYHSVQSRTCSHPLSHLSNKSQFPEIKGTVRFEVFTAVIMKQYSYTSSWMKVEHRV